MFSCDCSNGVDNCGGYWMASRPAEGETIADTWRRGEDAWICRMTTGGRLWFCDGCHDLIVAGKFWQTPEVLEHVLRRLDGADLYG